MKKICALLFLVTLIACNTQSPQEKIDNLNGYWGISEAKMADGQVKDYTFNAVVDYIEINENNKGFRKKVKPKLDGTYIVTDDIENIEIKIENDSINIYYTTEMDQWMETLISSEKDEIVLKNEYGNEYTYKRFTGYLDLDKLHGKEK